MWISLDWRDRISFGIRGKIHGWFRHSHTDPRFLKPGNFSMINQKDNLIFQKIIFFFPCMITIFSAEYVDTVHNSIDE